MNEMFGGLLSFENQEKLTSFVKNADKDIATKVIESAITYCQQEGMFSLEESFVLYNMLNKLKEK